MKTRASVLPLAAVGAALALSAAALARPPALTVVLPSGAALQAWRADWIRLAWPAAIVLAAGVSALAWRFSARIPAGSRLAAVRPLAWMPLVVACSHAGAFVGATAAGLALPLGTALVAAACAETFFRAGTDASAPRRSAVRSGALLFLASFAVLCAVWFGHAKAIGWRGGGDAKHYIVQLENLLERGDLDLTDRMERLMADKGVPATGIERDRFLLQSHLKRNGDGRIHSNHSFGYPLLAWMPARLFGPVGEEVLRALLGALALLGCWSACLVHGASRRAASVLSLFLGLSFPWIGTALSFLPEMSGLALCAWAVWAVPAQRNPRLRIAATAVSAAACGYLPFAHVRFAPLALALAGSFGVEALCDGGEPFWRRKAPRLAAYSAVCIAAWLLLRQIHRSFFGGAGAYDYGDIFLSEPLAMWGVLADRRGLASVLPAIWVLFAAPFRSLARGGADARRAALALATAACVLLSACSTIGALNGACLPGRYLMPVLPVLFPFLALAVDRTDRPGRLWIFFLAVLPVLYFLFVSFALSKNGLTASPAPLRRFSRLQAFWEPMPSFFFTGSAASRIPGSLFAAACLGLSLLACGRTRRVFRVAAFPALLATAFFAGRAACFADPPSRTDSFTALLSDRGLKAFRLLDGEPTTLFDAFREPDAKPSPEPLLALSDDSGLPASSAHRVHHPEAAGPDGLSWVPLRGRDIAPAANPGSIAFRVRGRVASGTARLSFATGGRPAGECAVAAGGPFDCILRGAVSPGGGGANVLVALVENRGTVFVDEFEFAPCPAGIESALPLLPNAETGKPTP